jgi:2-oxoglutarate dehydrogenase E2 component (dihydrolipoamide succinyltransferase)
MATQVLMPQLGEAIEEATITKWLKNEGDQVEEYEPIVEINTDKVDTEIPAPSTGILLKIFQPEEGATVQVGTVLALIGEPDEAFSESISITKEAVQSSKNRTSPTSHKDVEPIHSSVMKPEKHTDGTQDLGFISPVVAKIAAEHGVNLHKIEGSGLKGRITKKDIQSYINSHQIDRTNEGQTKNTEAQSRINQASIIPHSIVRRRIAEHMVMSRKVSPHVSTVFEADMSKIFSHRAVNKEAFEQNKTKITFTAYFVAATVLALRSFPILNSSWTDDGLLMNKQINIGLATSLGEAGLIVPVIKDADHLSLLGIAQSINDLANRARNKQLQPDEISGGTFTITNHGISGSLFAMPIINQPQSAILGIGKIQKRVIALEDSLGYDTIAVRPMVYLTLTFDHRVTDGAIADYFLAEVVNKLENWT